MQRSQGFHLAGLRFTEFTLTKASYFSQIYYHKQLQNTTSNVVSVSPISNRLRRDRHEDTIHIYLYNEEIGLNVPRWGGIQSHEFHADIHIDVCS